MRSALFPRLALLAAGLCAAAPAIYALSAYLPRAGQAELHPSVSYQWFDDFWFGKTPAVLPGQVVQRTVGLEGGYGFTDRLALDYATGYSRVNYAGGPLGGPGGIVLTKDAREDRSGLADSRVALAVSLTDEFASLNPAMPTVAVRVGAIIAGSYDTGFVNAVGNGGSGVEATLLLAKTFPLHGAGLTAELGYRWLDGAVPDAWTAALGAFKTFGTVTFSAGLREYHSTSGIDILGAGFASLDSFPATREINRTYELGLTWRYDDHIGYSLGYARTLEGRNTAKKNVLIFAADLVW